MSVISITITEASQQLVAGIPVSVSISANIPSTIFYTLDGTDPTTLSSVYTSTITLPRDVSSLILKVFATNGTDSSPIITETYSTNIMHNARLPHAALIEVGNTAQFPLFPYGSNSSTPAFDYVNSGAPAGITVLDPSKPVIPYGFTADGYTVGANQPINSYLNVYSTTDANGRLLSDSGTLPGTVTVIGRRSPTSYDGEESSRSSQFFNARAMVIFQDITTEDPSLPPQINPQFFTLEIPETYDNGAPLKANNYETPPVRGSYLRSHYNPRTQMMTDYYRCSNTNRWIISSYPYEPKSSGPGNMSSMLFSSRDQGAGVVLRWNLFRYSTLS